ncbi:MAG: GNAT family N-acetyltransferase [Cytophagales bacterium]|nr:GNAT family N-acetyltransferase [Bernardetiaceae bacterium]MDW8209839.1 GNAT family N-acetyltransferase [Cytophagales bacterium]
MPERLPCLIRYATERDVPQLWQMMREIAIIEHYFHRFQLTEERIRLQGFVKDPPDFYALVAENVFTKQLVAMAVYYFIPFSVAGAPLLFLKDLYVREPLRGKGLGKALLATVMREARQKGCISVRWSVPRWNKEGIGFCQYLGYNPDNQWLQFEALTS